MEEKTGRRRIRTVRYTLLLTPSEFALANKIAQQEYRTLPEFFRAQIYQRGAALGLVASLIEPASERHVTASG